MVVRTEIEWQYHPADVFEQPATFPLTDGELVVANGQAKLTLAQPSNPILDAVRERAAREVRSVFDLRQMQIHRSVTLEKNPTITHHNDDNGRHIVVNIEETLEIRSYGGVVDVIIRNADGSILDTKAERIREHTKFIAGLATKVARSQLLRLMLASYGKAVSDPDDELIHLYEMRDAATKHFGNQANAKRALGISSREWSRFGQLANAEPLQQGRHRGEQLGGLRTATSQELAEARALARRILEGVAATIP